MVGTESRNLYNQHVLSVMEVKKLFPPVFYQKEDELAGNLTGMNFSILSILLVNYISLPSYLNHISYEIAIIPFSTNMEITCNFMAEAMCIAFLVFQLP